MSEKEYWVYILHCDNDSYYTGYTTNLAKRYQAHLNGKGAKYTRSFKPLGIKASWKIIGDKSTAMQMERAIKKLSRAEKEELIQLYWHKLNTGFSNKINRIFA